MKHNIVGFLPIFLFLLAGVVIGCDSDSDSDSVTSTSPNVAVASFAFVDNDSVLDDLSSTFFSINLIAGTIYNADSLPYGTDVSAVEFDITFSATPSSVTIYTHDGDSLDYLDDDVDDTELDLTGEAWMLVVAPDEVTQKRYSIKVNVHSVVPDSLYWSELSSDDAFDITSTIQAMRVVNYQDQVLALVESDNTITCYTAASAEVEWTTATTVVGSYDVNTLQAGDELLYILDNNNELYTSTDGVAWTATGTYLKTLMGVYPSVDGSAEQLLAMTTASKRATYTEGVLTTETLTLPTLFPVSGASNSFVYASESVYSSSVLLYIMGGETASGALTNALWAYDGSKWSTATMNNIEIDTCAVTPRRDAALFGYQSYPTYEVFDTWVVYDTWMVIGGKDEDGEYLSDIYTSVSKGVSWTDNEETLINYPVDMQAAAYLSVIVQDEDVSTRATTRDWTSLMTPRASTTQTRATTDERTAPYIYMFGGEYAPDMVQNTVWRGVIERLTFAPIE